MAMNFAGEAYFQTNVPDYDAYIQRFLYVTIGLVVLCLVVLPTVVGIQIQSRAMKEFLLLRKSVNDNISKKKQVKQKKNKQPKKGSKNYDYDNDDKMKKEFEHYIDANPKKKLELETRQRDAMRYLQCVNLLCVLIVLCMMTFSPHNWFTSRGVFQSPMFTAEECQYVIDIAHRAAEKTYEVHKHLNEDEDSERILSNPRGWRKMRHSKYPTTDLNIVTDKFDPEDRRWLQQKMDARLAPVLTRLYGLGSPSAIRALDMFIVRYDHDSQPELNKHTDSGHISFNILLNEEFEGGGTRFEHGLETLQSFTINPVKGQVLTHTARLDHEGLKVTKGTRYILVGFLGIELINPFTKKGTGLSYFASWFNLNWLSTTFKNGYELSHMRLNNLRAGAADNTMLRENIEISSKRWTDNKYVRSLFRDIHRIIETVQKGMEDLFFTDSLVSHENATDYLIALDAAYEENMHRRDPNMIPRATWFEGQQLMYDFDGTVGGAWRSRLLADEEVFTDEL